MRVRMFDISPNFNMEEVCYSCRNLVQFCNNSCPRIKRQLYGELYGMSTDLFSLRMFNTEQVSSTRIMILNGIIWRGGESV